MVIRTGEENVSHKTLWEDKEKMGSFDWTQHPMNRVIIRIIRFEKIQEDDPL